jgi:hypothetical protein
MDSTTPRHEDATDPIGKKIKNDGVELVSARGDETL